MHRLLREGILITFGMLITCIIGSCAGDDPTESTTESGEIKLLVTTPGDDGAISVNGELQMIFSGFIGGVTVDGRRATIMSDNRASMQIADLGDVAPGTKKTVIISWANLDFSFIGTQTISFTLTPAPATTVEVDPAPGSAASFYSNTEFTLTFDQEVVAVWLNDVPASGSEVNWKVTPYLWTGAGQTLNIKWVNRDGSTDSMEVGPYYIADNGGDPPLIVSGTVEGGATDVDPAPINAGGFRFDFDEDVAGTIRLTGEAGVDLRWQGSIAGDTATLTPIAGQELVNGTTYKIEIKVQDGSGNQTQATITFVTKPK